MRKPFKKDYVLTQGWGVNEPAYRRFGLKGHNGTDWGTPTGTEIIAPHDGKVLEVADEGGDGYGRYIKIENGTEGSLLAHLKEARVKVGDQVKEGDVVAISNNTGNSTGPHLHWGYYRLPRNRQDGFGGFIDPFPYISSASPIGSITLDHATFEHLVDKATKYDNLLPEHERVKKLLKDNEETNKQKDEIIKQKDLEIAEVKKQRDESDKAIITLNSKIADLTEAIKKDAVDDKDNLILAKELEEKLAEKDRETTTEIVEPVINEWGPILEEFFNNLIKGKRTKSWIDRIWHWFS